LVRELGLHAELRTEALRLEQRAEVLGANSETSLLISERGLQSRLRAQLLRLQTGAEVLNVRLLLRLLICQRCLEPTLKIELLRLLRELLLRVELLLPLLIRTLQAGRLNLCQLQRQVALPGGFLHRLARTTVGAGRGRLRARGLELLLIVLDGLLLLDVDDLLGVRVHVLRCGAGIGP
jgi:hypothetical protein